MDKHVFLIGARASGKSSLGRMLAECLGASFTDTDDLIVEREGRTVAELVDAGGWELFRERETAALEAACAEAPQVIACGGGVVLAERNRELLASGEVLYLRADPEVLAARLTADPLTEQRPSLTGQSIAEEIAEVLAKREDLYRECADHILEAALPLVDLVDQALQDLGLGGG